MKNDKLTTLIEIVSFQGSELDPKPFESITQSPLDQFSIDKTSKKFQCANEIKTVLGNQMGQEALTRIAMAYEGGKKKLGEFLTSTSEKMLGMAEKNEKSLSFDYKSFLQNSRGNLNIPEELNVKMIKPDYKTSFASPTPNGPKNRKGY